MTYDDVNVKRSRSRLWGDNLRQVAAALIQPVSASVVFDEFTNSLTTAAARFDDFARLSEVGVLVVDRGGKCVACNDQARAILNQNDGLLLAHSSVVALTPGDKLVFRSALDAALQPRAPEGTAEVSILALQRLGRSPLTVAIAPLASSGYSPAGAMLILVDPDRNLEESIRVVCRLYHLTEAECRLAQHLVSGWTIAEAADLMAIKIATARAYLKQIFAKTGINRQSSLIRLLLTSRVPLMLGAHHG